MSFYDKSVEDTEKELQSSSSVGLSVEDAATRLEKNGFNELKEGKKQPLILKFLKQFADALIIILLIAAVVSLIIDIHEWIDSVIIFIVVIINAILGTAQESKAEKSLEALKKMSSPIAKVLRGGNVEKIPSKEVVVGDVILIEAGDFIPADARLIEAANLKADESALTGESLPVQKTFEIITSEKSETSSVPLGDRKNMLFSSSFVTYGRGKAIVTATGMDTEVGKIAKMLDENKTETTPLQNKLTQVGKLIGIMCLAICAIVFFIEWRFGLSGGVNVLEAFKTAVALAVAAVPEGLATVVTIVLALGVTKMAKQNAIVKRLPAVETLGSTSIICSDKTGTLTQNKMTVLKYYDLKEVKDLSVKTESSAMLAADFAFCCDARIDVVDGVEKRVGDPTETALIEFNNRYGNDISSRVRIGELPFDSERKMMTVVYKNGEKFISITKGAPDVILRRITNKETVSGAEKANAEMAKDALRVLGLAVKEYDKMPEIDFSLEEDMTFTGLVGMIDPPRPEVIDAIKTAKAAGMRTVMITGDHVATASAIAKQLGILEDGETAVSTEELQKMSDDELFQNIDKYSVYARVTPSDKVRIVDTWQKKGKIVAMTGDGVNDSPALKKADIGCAMGITGTDVAKEAADMILTDDNFSTIVYAVKEGRGIYANVKRCVKFLLSSNIGEVFTIFMASLISLLPALEFGVPLAAIHLLWINLITDSLPAIGLGMEKASASVMSDKPREKSEGFFAGKMALHIVLEGIIIGALTLTAYVLGHVVFGSALTEEQATLLGQTMAFVTLSLLELFHVFNNKTEGSIFNKNLFNNKMLNIAFLIGFGLTVGVLYIPFVNTKILSLVPLQFYQLATCFGLALSIVVIMEIYKVISRKWSEKRRNRV